MDHMDTSQLKAFLDSYEEYAVKVLKPTNAEIKMVFEKWKDPAHWSLATRLSRLPSPSPVQRTTTRIKRPESVVDKILRNPDIFPGGLTIESARAMSDAVAGRVVCYFLSNLPLIDNELRHSEHFEISAVSPPVAYLSHDLLERLSLSHVHRIHKESGYASIHYTLRLRTSEVPMLERPWFELQLRTLVEDVWGEVEHILGYKPNKKTTFAVRRQFQIISSELTAIDEHFNLLFEELARFQEESPYKDESPLNAENLPAVLNEIGLGCAQKEINGLLKLLASRGLEIVGELRSVATTHNLDLIRATFKTAEDRIPTHFDVVASLAAIKGLVAERDKVQAIKSQLEFLQAWEKLKKDLA